MAIRRQRLKKLLLRTLPLLAVFAVLLVSLVLVSDVQRDESGFNRQYLWVLVLTGLALLVLVVAIIDRIIRLVRRVRSKQPGARLAARWVRNFLLLSLPPAIIVYVFSAYFLTRTVDSWFDVQVEAALGDSLRLGQQFLDNRTMEVRNQVRRISTEIDTAGNDAERLRRALLGRIRDSGPRELTVMERDGHVLATANIDALAALPQRPGDYALLQAIETGEFAAAEPDGGGLRIRVIQRLTTTPGESTRLVQAFYPLPESITALTNSIEREYFRYQNVNYLRESLKQSFLLILSVVLLLSMLLAILAALNAARRMVAPISRLADATQQVAGGELGQSVTSDTDDELGFLLNSFNDMTEALKQASEEAESSRARLQAQGEYLETVLGSLSAGVLTLDLEGRIVTANPAASDMLRIGQEHFSHASVSGLAESVPWLEPFEKVIAGQFARGTDEWQREIRLERSDAPLVLLVRGSRLPDVVDGISGHVVVFDDVTILNQVQREAAWAEVAQRLAHEVKNPLTPIRLAAERLRMKLQGRLDSNDGAMLDRATNTIVAQVEALRTLVDAFGDYAREPEINRQPMRMDELVENVVALYQDTDPGLKVAVDLCPGPDGLVADGGRLRQLLHNLIRNAREAHPGSETAEVSVITRLVEDKGSDWLELVVADRGPGFPDAVLEKPFEPYVTNKHKGSGLGLAICRKIVAEHNGRISIANRDRGGASARILLPLRRQGERPGSSSTLGRDMSAANH